MASSRHWRACSLNCCSRDRPERPPRRRRQLPRHPRANMRTFLIGTLVGLLVGAALVFFLFGGVPRAAKAPGEPIKPPDPQSQTTSAQVVIKQDLLNHVLTTIFKQMQPPSFPLQIGALAEGSAWPRAMYALEEGCVNQIQVLPEGSGVT